VDVFKANWEKAYPSAVARLLEDFQSLAVHLRFPAEHWRRIRHTNMKLSAPSASRGDGPR